METINHECYVSLEVAKLLEEAGFDWECREHYPSNFMARRYEDYAKPTLDVAQRWLREVKGIEVPTEIDDNQNDCRNCGWYCLYKINKEDYKYLMNEPFRHLKRFTSYEEAQEAGIKKALEIILDKEE